MVSGWAAVLTGVVVPPPAAGAPEGAAVPLEVVGQVYSLVVKS